MTWKRKCSTLPHFSGSLSEVSAAQEPGQSHLEGASEKCVCIHRAGRWAQTVLFIPARHWKEPKFLASLHLFSLMSQDWVHLVPQSSEPSQA